MAAYLLFPFKGSLYSQLGHPNIHSPKAKFMATRSDLITAALAGAPPIGTATAQVVRSHGYRTLLTNQQTRPAERQGEASTETPET